MSEKIEELKKQEIEDIITNNENNEVMELEQLILQGAESRIPIMIDYPVFVEDHVEYKPVSAFIKPLTNTQSNKAYAMGIANKKSTPNIELVKIGLYDKNMEHLKPELVEKMPSGIIDAICKQLMDISGIKIDEDAQYNLVRKLMDF